MLTYTQFALLGSAIVTSVSVPLGLGHHVEDVPIQNLGYIGLLGNINGTFSILAAAWSKTSFALTLLRLMDKEKWARNFLWFAIVSMNMLMFGNALFQWIKCWPISKTWNVLESGTCWPPGIQTRYGVFVGCKSLKRQGYLGIALTPLSILRSGRHHLVSSPMEVGLVLTNEDEREARSGYSNEPRYFVSGFDPHDRMRNWSNKVLLVPA